MKNSFIRSMVPALAGVFFLFTALASQAQVVTTGIVTAVSAAQGVVTVRSDQNNRSLNYRGMDRAKIMRANGAPAKLEDVWTGMRVTVSYAQRGNRWYVGSLAIPDVPRYTQDNTVWLLTPGQRHGMYAPRSNDITKRPGNIAASDNDITTKPPRRALFENDITLRNDNR
jgi:hypothetical protein